MEQVEPRWIMLQIVSPISKFFSIAYLNANLDIISEE